jgi:uridine kinase
LSAPPRSFVVSINGPSGAGKSTLAANVAARLGDAVQLNADDYDADWRHPDDVGRWIAEGADPDAFAWPTFAAHLRALRAGQAVTRPDGALLSPARVIVTEQPFGRALTELHGLIDLVVWLGVPPDIALARRMHRTVGYALRDGGDPAGILARMDWYLNLYLHHGLPDLYRAAESHVRRDCDVVLDGMQEPDALADRLVEAIAHRAAP